LKAIDAADLRTYPQPTAAPLRTKVAEHHNMTKENVLITHGGDEALRLAITTFVEPGSPLGCANPSYSLYPVLAGIQNAPVLQVEYGEDWTLPADFPHKSNDAASRLKFMVNPHAPSGRLMSADDCARLATELDGVLLLDEAYANFIDPALGYDSAPLVKAHDNLLILRSFSKGYSLAGLRLGYLIGQQALIEPLLTKTRDSYNIDAISQRLGLAALDDQDYAMDTWRRVRAERSRLNDELARRGLACPPSETNFLLAQVPANAKLSAKALYEALKARGILVRHFDTPRLGDALRISIGTPAQNRRLLKALDDLQGDVPTAR
ncbi:MAG: aminotransferase class I/II-fold pyridoxal phosphate-dependent enzyme, partial [Gammaproteobacteria bacterium]|nr:aminotransferase class I/II-fold pyridoxal phosphate-dependent enzyme [Gammaproteobacteria bacterium]